MNRKTAITGSSGERETLRRRILALRDGIMSPEKERLSRKICDRLRQLTEFATAKVVFMYASFRSEVTTRELIRQSLAENKRVAVPFTVVSRKRLLALEITDPATDLAPGYCGIPEPDPEKAPRLDPAAIEAVIVPGSVFDPQGGRLGYGGGYYDRFLQYEAPQACRIGLAFEAQLVDAIPLMPHDQRLDYLVTEQRICDPGARKRI